MYATLSHTRTQCAGSWGRVAGNPYCRDIPWSEEERLLEAWRAGATGYPWIDACMAQLRYVYYILYYTVRSMF